MYSQKELMIMSEIVLERGLQTQTPIPITYTDPETGETEGIFGYNQVDAVLGFLHGAHGVERDGASLLCEFTREQCRAAVQAVIPRLTADPASFADFNANAGDWHKLGRQIQEGG